MAEVFKQCPDCLAHYTGHHECFGLMKMLVTAHKEKQEKKNGRCKYCNHPLDVPSWSTCDRKECIKKRGQQRRKKLLKK